MTPLWDALNHVTGEANVRLNHCKESGDLQMISTRAIAAGAEVLCPLFQGITPP